ARPGRRSFGEYAFLEDSRYASQLEICGARGFIRLARAGGWRLWRERIEIATRLVDHSNAGRVGSHESDYSLISRLKRSISAPRCGLSLSQSMVRILARSSWVLAIASVIAPSSFTFELVGITS